VLGVRREGLQPRAGVHAMQGDRVGAAAMNWTETTRADPDARAIADRHYNRQKVGAKQFVPPGRCLVLRMRGALWITSWPFAEFVHHAWPGAWVCSAFRNESSGMLSSHLIIDAIAATRATWPDPLEHGMITFVDADEVKRKRDPGRCFLRAGFENTGWTKGGLVALQMPAARLKYIPPREPLRTQLRLAVW